MTAVVRWNKLPGTWQLKDLKNSPLTINNYLLKLYGVKITHTHTHTHTLTHTHTDTHTHTHTYIHTYIYIYIAFEILLARSTLSSKNLFGRLKLLI